MSGVADQTGRPRQRRRGPTAWLLVTALGAALAWVGAAQSQTGPPPPPPEAAPLTSPATPDPSPPAEAAPLPSGEGRSGASTVGGSGAPEPEATSQPLSRMSAAQVFRIDFMRRGLAAGLLVAVVCALLGVYVVLRRIVFVGIALAEVSAAGLALALLVGISPMVGSVALMLLGVTLFSVRWAPRKVSQESFIGIGWAVASAGGILLVAKSAQGESHMLDLIFGDILMVTPGDIARAAVVLGAVLLLHLLFAKEFLFVSFDPETVAAMGYRARLWDLLLYATIGLAISFSIQVVGVLMTFSALVLPPVAALLVARRMRTAALLAMALSALAVPLGLYISFVRDLPTSATVVAVSFLLLVLVALASRLAAYRPGSESAPKAS